MKKLFQLTIPVTLIILTSCVRSLYPLTEDEHNLIFRSELLGAWVDSDSTHYIIDTARGKNGKLYRVAVIEQKKGPEAKDFSDTSYFLVALVSISGRMFVDCSADMDRFQNKTLGESAVQSVLVTHYIMRLNSIAKNSIDLAYIDQDKFSSLLKQKKFSIKHEMIDENDVLLTSRPGDLQKKLIELERFPSVFVRSVFTRATD